MDSRQEVRDDKRDPLVSVREKRRRGTALGGVTGPWAASRLGPKGMPRAFFFFCSALFPFVNTPTFVTKFKFY
jgi:hypothetical protein